MSIEAMNWAYQQKVGRSTAKAILISLANQANQDGQCWPSIEYTAKRVEVTSRAVITNLKYLAEKGFLKKQTRAGDGGGRKSNFYTLTMRQSEPSSPRDIVNEDHQQSEPDAVHSETGSPKQSITIKEQSLFEQTRKIKPKNPNDNRRASLKAWKARIREGIKADDLIAGRERYAAHCLAETTEPRFIKHDSTFFGPNRFWEQPWEAIKKVPEDRADIIRMARENGIDPDQGYNLSALRKMLADRTGMQL